MKKVKVICMACAIFLGIGGAFASRITAKVDCNGDYQYYLVGTNYFQTGQEGVTYLCDESPLTCTYYKPNPITQPNTYAPCDFGLYTPID